MSSLEESLKSLSKSKDQVDDEEEIPQELFDKIDRLTKKLEDIERQIMG